MRPAEKIELVLIGFAVTVSLWIPLPAAIAIGQLLLALAVLYLSQGLLRDLWLISRRRAGESQSREATCMCVESALGVSLVVLGLLAIATGLSFQVALNNWWWALLITATLLLGFVLKDYIFTWNPWRIHKDPDHFSLVFRWRK